MGFRCQDDMKAMFDVGRSVANRSEPFSLGYRGLGTFPKGRREPRILWAGLNPSDPLINLASRLKKDLTQAGLITDGKKFSPHVTLARRRPSKTSSGPFDLNYNGSKGWNEWPVRELYLVESTLKPAGPIYTVRGSWKLTGSADGLNLK